MFGTLFLHFQRASIIKHISYRHEKLPRQQVMEIIREIETAGNFNQDTLGHWKTWMTEHNRIVERGERMMLMQCRATNLRWIKYRRLDLFMLQMQSRHIAGLLDDFSSFGERVLLLIHESPASLFWVIGGQIVVEHTRWRRLCGQMMTLLHVLGVADPFPRQSRWPDRDLLEAAAARARGVFGRFAQADTSRPTVLSPRVSRHPRSDAAGPRRRRREVLEPPGLPPREAVPDSTPVP